jgi:hypothetical protein
MAPPVARDGEPGKRPGAAAMDDVLDLARRFF